MIVAVKIYDNSINRVVQFSLTFILHDVSLRDILILYMAPRFCPVVLPL